MEHTVKRAPTASPHQECARSPQGDRPRQAPVEATTQRRSLSLHCTKLPQCAMRMGRSAAVP